MRESIATAFDENLDSVLERERPVDRIAALGFSDSLGSDIIRAKDGLQPEALRRALYLLVKRASQKFKCERTMMERLAAQALREHLLPLCRTCQGTKERIQEELKVVCHACNGSGNHRYTDNERARSLGISREAYGKGWERRLEIVHTILTSADVEVIRSVRFQLERDQK